MQKTFRRHYLQAAVIILIGLVMQGCGGKKELTVKLQSSKVKGLLGDYLEAKSGEYKIQKTKEDGSEWSISVPLKKLKKSADACNNYNINIDLDLLDSKGQPLATEVPFRASTSYVDGNKICNLIQTDNTGEDFIVFRASKSLGNEIKLPDDISSFAVTSDVRYKGNNEPAKSLDEDFSKSASSSSDKSPDDNTVSGSQDWDKLLKDYEAYTDKYISLMQKVKKNDASAMSDYQDMYEKAEKLGKDLDKAQSKLSSEQLSKMLQIQTKLANAAMEMAK